MLMADTSDASGVWVIGNPGRCDASLIMWGGFLSAFGTQRREFSQTRLLVSCPYAEPPVCLQSV